MNFVFLNTLRLSMLNELAIKMIRLLVPFRFSSDYPLPKNTT